MNRNLTICWGRMLLCLLCLACHEGKDTVRGETYPPILDILNVGDYHGAEPWLYSDCLKRNMQLRVAEYMKHRE